MACETCLGNWWVLSGSVLSTPQLRVREEAESCHPGPASQMDGLGNPVPEREGVLCSGIPGEVRLGGASVPVCRADGSCSARLSRLPLVSIRAQARWGRALPSESSEGEAFGTAGEERKAEQSFRLGRAGGLSSVGP